MLDQQIPNSEPLPNLTKTESKRFNLIVLLLLIIAIFVSGAVGFYLGKQSIQNSDVDENEIDLPIDTEEKKESLPSGWEYKLAEECSVSFPVPPRSNPYVDPTDGSFWQFPHGGVYPHMLSKLETWNSDSHEQETMMFAPAEEGGSGYIPAAISVTCIPNIAKLNNDTLLENLKNGIAKYNAYDDVSKEMSLEAAEYFLVSFEKTSRWSKEVIDLTVKEGLSEYSYTIFATPEYLYEVRILQETEDSFVRETALKIFNYLDFQD